MRICMRVLLSRMLQCSVTLLSKWHAMGPAHNPITPPIGRFLPLTGPHFSPARRKTLPGFLLQDGEGRELRKIRQHTPRQNGREDGRNREECPPVTTSQTLTLYKKLVRGG